MLLKLIFKIVGILSVLMLFQNQANAEINPMLGTLETRHRELSHAGNLTGCELSFETIAQDFSYKNGETVVGIGSISVNLVEDKSEIFLGILMKLGLLELEKFTDKNSESEITSPNFIFIKSKDFNSAGQPYVKISADTKGFQLIALKESIEQVKLLSDIANEGNFIMGFNRHNNGMDVYLPVDITVRETMMSDGSFKRIHSQDTLNNFRACFLKMLEKVAKQ